MPDWDMNAERDLNDRTTDEFRRNSGKVGGVFEGFPLLLLTSTGAKTGAQRMNPLGYFEIDGKTYIIGSAAGRDRDPAWANNIRANPTASVEIGTDAPRTVTAHELPRDERDRIYAIVAEGFPQFTYYQKQTDRVIPVFELTR